MGIRVMAIKKIVVILKIAYLIVMWSRGMDGCMQMVYETTREA